MLNSVTEILQKARQKRRTERMARNESVEVPNVFPELLNVSDDLTSIENEYRALHEVYTTQVSDTLNAASLRQVAFLAWLVRTRPFRRILDTGSGFSSFVLRREALRKGNITHYAIEDNEFWIGRTRQFFQDQQVPAENLLSWESFRADTTSRDFDFVFHDMGNMTTRIVSLPEIAGRTTSEAWLLLDDMHKAAYYPHALQILGALWVVQSLVDLTMDEHDRYACICRRKS